MTIFLSQNSVYILIFLNIIYLLSFIFYRGSEYFFELILIDNNLNFFVIFLLLYLYLYTLQKILFYQHL